VPQGESGRLEIAGCHVDVIALKDLSVAVDLD
jgi:hypothetical protein